METLIITTASCIGGILALAGVLLGWRIGRN